jgi:UDP-N-acetylmuramoyl-tripeptide--D-alanyl-D-alanine ligase
MEKEIAKRLIINYLKFLSHIKLRSKFRGEIIALGGCFGKSSAVNMLRSVLESEHNVYTTYQNDKGLNSESGVAFAILDVHPDRYRMIDWLRYSVQALGGLFKKFDHDYFIIELGVDKPNDLKFLTSFIKPNLGILINSNNTHSANFEEFQETTKKSFEELIAYENGFIFEAAKDAIVYNLDDPEVVKQIARFSGRTTIPFSVSNNPSITSFIPSLSGTNISFIFGGTEHTLTHPMPLLEEYRNTIEMVIKVAEYYKLKPESVIRGIEAYELPVSRCSHFEGLNGSHIIDSSYNSSFVPAASAITLVDQIAQGRKVAVLGDMRELGLLSEKEHRKLAHVAAEHLDVVITVGPMMKEYFATEFAQLQKEGQQLFAFDTTKEALAFISDNNFGFVQQDDVVLVKASQNTLFLEIIVEALLKDKSNVSKLCRRGAFYAEERRKLLA